MNSMLVCLNFNKTLTRGHVSKAHVNRTVADFNLCGKLEGPRPSFAIDHIYRCYGGVSWGH